MRCSRSVSRAEARLCNRRATVASAVYWSFVVVVVVVVVVLELAIPR